MILTAFKSLLETAAGVNAYPLVLPQGVAPAITYGQANDEREQVYGSTSGLQFMEVDVDCWGESYLDARAVADSLTGALPGYRGDVDGEHIDNAWLIRSLDVYEEAAELYRVALTFRISYTLN
jgi:hypothetical protein